VIVQDGFVPWMTGLGVQVTVPFGPALAVMSGPRKLATAVFGASTVIVQALLVVVQAPVQPTKVSPTRATAVSVTFVPVRKSALCVAQPGPQLMTAGADVTVPWPVSPAILLTVSE